MELFSKAFDWIAGLSKQLPTISFKAYFIVVVAVILGICAILALTFAGSRAAKLKSACKKVLKYLDGVDAVNDDNLSDFNDRCFSSKVPQSLRDAWLQYAGVRFGYPSEIVTEKAVYEREVRKVKDVRACVYLAIAFILLAAFSFWGYGTLRSNEMGVIHLAGLVLSGIGFLILVLINRGQVKSCLTTFEKMQEELDCKVNLQIERNYAIDSSPLTELASIMDEIISRNTVKDMSSEDAETDEITPLEALIEDGENVEETQQPVAEETSDEVVVEDNAEVQPDEAEPVEEPVEEALEDAPVEDQAPVEEVETIENVEEEQIEEALEDVVEQEPVEESVDEEVQEPAQDIAEDSEEVNEPETAEDSVEEELADEAVPNDDETVESSQETEPADEVEPVDEFSEEPEEPVENVESVPEEANDADDGEPVESEDNDQELAPEENEDKDVVYSVESVDEDAEAKPAKLSKMPNLIDYILQANRSPAVLINVSKMLVGAYAKFKDSPEDKAIVKECLGKLVAAMRESLM